MKTIIGIAIALLLVLTTRPAEAYLDPGSGSMVFQLIVGGIAGLILAVKIFWRRILSLVGIKSHEENTPQQS